MDRIPFWLVTIAYSVVERDLRVLQERDDAKDARAERDGDAHGDAASDRAMAWTSRCQLAVSSPSRFRPAAVRRYFAFRLLSDVPHELAIRAFGQERNGWCACGEEKMMDCATSAANL